MGNIIYTIFNCVSVTGNLVCMTATYPFLGILHRPLKFRNSWSKHKNDNISITRQGC